MSFRALSPGCGMSAWWLEPALPGWVGRGSFLLKAGHSSVFLSMGTSHSCSWAPCPAHIHPNSFQPAPRAPDARLAQGVPGCRWLLSSGPWLPAVGTTSQRPGAREEKGKAIWPPPGSVLSVLGECLCSAPSVPRGNRRSLPLPQLLSRLCPRPNAEAQNSSDL